MAQEPPAWLRAEREYRDELPDRCTVPELFEDSAARHLDRPAQHYKGGVYDRSLVAEEVVPAAQSGEFATLTYGEMRDVVRKLAAGLRALGLDAGDRVGIYANTRMEWAQADFAALAAGCVVTTVYTESSSAQLRYLLEDPGAKVAIVENEGLLETLLEVEDSLDLEHIVLIDEPAGTDDREDIHTLGAVYERGAAAYDAEAYRGWLDERDPEDLASLVYTSGTTGDPKGVKLSHHNFRTNVRQVHRRFCPRPDKEPGMPTLDEETRAVSFLPLAHVFERLSGHFALFSVGASVGYAEDPDTLTEDFPKLAPTTAGSVPRVYERIYEGIREQASESDAKARIFEWAAGVARRYADADSPGPLLRLKHGIADRLVYSTVRERLGGNIEFLVSGGGSLSPDLIRLFLGMGITVVEGYGLTETSPVVSTNPLEDIRPGTLGPPVVGVETRIDESVVPQEEFEAAGQVGELLVRGDNVTEGYWQNPGATEEAFDDDWFRTGDIVAESPDGYLTFRERLKQLLVLSTGKNVAPGPIEDRFATSERIDQIMLVGDGRKYVAALIVPNFGRLREWAAEEGISLPEDDEAVCEDDRAREWVREGLAEVNADLSPHESVERFELVTEEWTAENGMLTPSMKKVRRRITDAYEEKVERLYAEEAAAD
ncbi:MAG: long-chain fatty acid--CoA ligase [Haloarculaceae archaeon]